MVLSLGTPSEIDWYDLPYMSNQKYGTFVPFCPILTLLPIAITPEYLFQGYEWEKLDFEHERGKIQLGIHLNRIQHTQISLKQLDTNFYSEMPLPKYIFENGLV